MIYKILITLLLTAVMVFPSESSTITKINDTRGAERILARLEYALSVSQTDFASALLQAEDALSEARDMDNQVLVATSLFQLSQIHKDNNDTEKRTMYLNLAYPIAKKNNAHGLSSKILVELGHIHRVRGDNSEAIEYYNIALDEADKVDNYRVKGTCYSSIGSIFRVLGAFEDALESIVKAKSNYHLANFEEGEAWIAYTLGRLYRDLGKSEEAHISFKESLEKYTSMAQANGDSIGIALCLDQIGLINLELNKIQVAEPYIQRSLDIYTSQKSNYGISNSWKNLGKIEYAKGNYSKANQYFQKALESKVTSMDALGIPGIYEYLGLILIVENRWQTGIDTLLIGLEKAIASNQRQIQHNIYGRIAKAFEDRGELSEALRYYKLQFGLHDQISPNPVQFKLPELRGIYEMELSRQEIRTLNQKNEIINLQLSQQRTIKWALSIVGLFLLIFSGLVFKQYRKIHAVNILNEELIVNLKQEIDQRIKAEKERRILEDKLRQSQKLEAIGTMVNGIAHEINNVLQGIVLYGGILEGQLQDEKSKESLKAMMKGSDRAKHIVSQIMAFSRQSEENISSYDPMLIIREAVDLQRAIMSSQVEIIEDYGEDCGSIRCDSTQMQQIIINLFNNAQHAMADGGTITVSLNEMDASDVTREKGDNHPMLELSISDTGIGMEPETLEKIFDPFFSTKDVGEGTGLGLSVVHGLIEQMGGTISATSELGEGTKFRILLPAIND